MKSIDYVPPFIQAIEIESQSVIAASASAQERQLKAQQRREEEKAKEEAKLNALKVKYGEPTRVLTAAQYKLYIFDKKNLLVIDEKEIRFPDIVSCQLEKKVLQGKERLVEKEVPITLDHVVHNRVPEKRHHVIKDPDVEFYYIVLAVNDLSKPTYTFELRSDLTKAMELKGLFDVIISRNN